MQRKLGISSTLIIADSMKSCQMFARVQRCFFILNGITMMQDILSSYATL